MAEVRDQRRQLTFDTDVLVAGRRRRGGGSFTAARGGARVFLERYGFCGGAAVAGMSGTVCGLYAASADSTAGLPAQVVFGFADEFVRLARSSRGGLQRRRCATARPGPACTIP